jgi:hypothetical protein
MKKGKQRGIPEESDDDVGEKCCEKETKSF